MSLVSKASIFCLEFIVADLKAASGYDPYEQPLESFRLNSPGEENVIKIEPPIQPVCARELAESLREPRRNHDQVR